MITWFNSGMELHLDSKPFILMAHDNFGMVDTPRIEDSAPMQHGTTDRGFTLPARNIVLYIELFANSWEHYYQLRSKLLGFFTPSENPGELVIEEGDITRRIEGFPVGGLGFADSDREYQSHVIPVVIHCPDPLWKSKDGYSLTIEGGGSADVGSVPTTIPFTVGTSTFEGSSAVVYRGSFETYPDIVVIRGPITDPVITNGATGAKIDFTGTTVAAGSQLIIELGYGRFRVTDGSGANMIDKLSADSDLVRFKLSPGTVNSFQVEGTSITSTTNVYMQWFERFIGV